MYINYLHSYEKYKEKSYCELGLGCLGDCLWYLTRLLSRKPEQVISLIYKLKQIELDKKDIPNDYVYFIHRTALLYYYYKDYLVAAYWAKKGMDTVNYFFAYLNEASRKKILNDENLYFSSCASLFEECKFHFDPQLYKDAPMDWEKDFYYPSAAANTNEKNVYLL